MNRMDVVVVILLLVIVMLLVYLIWMSANTRFIVRPVINENIYRPTSKWWPELKELQKRY